MPTKKAPLIASVGYEHRNSSGKLNSKGYQRVDWRGRTHIIQEDGRGRLIGEIVVDKQGNIVKITNGDPENAALLEGLVNAINANKDGSQVESKSK